MRSAKVVTEIGNKTESKYGIYIKNVGNIKRELVFPWPLNDSTAVRDLALNCGRRGWSEKNKIKWWACCSCVGIKDRKMRFVCCCAERKTTKQQSEMTTSWEVRLLFGQPPCWFLSWPTWWTSFQDTGNKNDVNPSNRIMGISIAASTKIVLERNVIIIIHYYTHQPRRTQLDYGTTNKPNGGEVGQVSLYSLLRLRNPGRIKKERKQLIGGVHPALCQDITETRTKKMVLNHTFRSGTIWWREPKVSCRQLTNNSSRIFFFFSSPQRK